MPNYANRTLAPAAYGRLLASLFIGIVLSAGFFYAWKTWMITKPQARNLSLYAKVSMPLGKTISENSVRAVFGDTPVSHPRLLNKQKLILTLRSMVYRGEPISNFVKFPAIVLGVILLSSLTVGLALRAIQVRQTMNALKLRGPDMMTVDQYNKTSKGDGIAFQVQVEK